MNIFLEAKEKLGLRYADLTDATGFDKGYLHGVLHGTRAFQIACLVKLTGLLNIDKEDAIKAWKEMELERLKKALDADCNKILKIFYGK